MSVKDKTLHITRSVPFSYTCAINPLIYNSVFYQTNDLFLSYLSRISGLALAGILYNNYTQSHLECYDNCVGICGFPVYSFVKSRFVKSGGNPENHTIKNWRLHFQYTPEAISTHKTSWGEPWEITPKVTILVLEIKMLMKLLVLLSTCSWL